jgi:hypothetical protein
MLAGVDNSSPPLFSGKIKMSDAVPLGRSGRGVDLNQLKLDWVTSEAKRLKQRTIRIDIDFKYAFNSMSQTALWAMMRAYNIPDVDLLEAIYGRTTACMDSDDAECAIITFLTGVIQGGASSPRIFIVFINALLEHLTSTGKALGISHGMVGTEQFNNIAFMDDITTLAQDSTGAQILLNAIQDFADWSNMQLNLGKTVVIDIDGGSGQLDPPKLTYKQPTVETFQAAESCRHLGYWATPNGDMVKTKKRVLTKTREVLGLLKHHPLESKIAKELFHSMAVSVFRFSAAQVRGSKAELDQLNYGPYGCKPTSGRNCSFSILARHYEIVRLRDNRESVIDDMMDQLNSHIKKTNGPPVTWLITRVSFFVEQSYAAV